MRYSKLVETYIPRIIDSQVQVLLATFCGIELCGPRWSGNPDGTVIWREDTWMNPNRSIWMIHSLLLLVIPPVLLTSGKIYLLYGILYVIGLEIGANVLHSLVLDRFSTPPGRMKKT